MPREQDEQVGAHVCDERLNVEGKVRVAVLVGATVVAVFLALAPGGFAQGLESGADAEREKAFVEALRREDPEGAKRYVALRDARGHAIAELQRAQARYGAAGSELRPVVLGQLRDAQRRYAETSLALLDFLDARDRRALARYQKEIGRINRLAEERTRARAEFEKLLRGE
ncbi:MAG: hypothetical protein DMD99_12470 [Candidatus Rokuibacteriota bacterium]|nr:MAG: hypothetical protein DMD99_12470 [Candidatus Rokubacteria bacterium]